MRRDFQATVSKELEGAIFEAALGMEDAAVREEFLQRMFLGDPSGLERMERLLEAARDAVPFFLEADEERRKMAGEILDEAAPAEAREAAPLPPPPREEPGAVIGRYRLVERIGQGGCGVVYEAEQTEPVRRRVALKIVHIGMETEGVIARFEMERQALAMMDHPNIAKVLDAGATAAGRPYFVMELVRGERITAYCDARKLDVERRLELFLQVCQAIQHAHHKGVIHRDIKPSNVIVSVCDGAAIPKVIDFGIAKATQRRAFDRDPLTLRDQPIGTPAYMSPEQVDMTGLDVDTRSDVYGLGILLYEMLTGNTPFDGEVLLKSGMLEMRRTLIECEPPAPSGLLAGLRPEREAEIAAMRGLDAAGLIRRIRGDLDWIVLKAIEKDRNRRYQTANSLAADVKRHLASEPVLARRPGRLYLLQKFIRRNRTACISGVAIAASLVAGLGASTWLYFRERAAHWEQKRLSVEAEAARAQEAHLREQAQARANLSRVAVLLSEGEVEQADALLRQHPLESVEPSREAAAAFRSLGDWYAIYGRWDQAARCFVLLNQANKIDNPRKIVQGNDLLASAPALLEHGDERLYEEFREEMLDRYLPVTNVVEADHLLKVCLLTPANASILGRLEDTAALCEGKIAGDQVSTRFPAWEAFSLTLHAMRSGNDAKVFEWSAKALADARSVSRSAATHSITAIVHCRRGENEAARRDLDIARRQVEELSRMEDDSPRRAGGEPWFDRAVARILLREAEGVLAGDRQQASK